MTKNIVDRVNIISLGFVIYKPEKALLTRLKIAIDNGFRVYIFDNTPYDSSFIRDFTKANQLCEYITCGKNVGLGFGISSVCAQAYYDSFSTLLFFDQDTVFDLKTLNYINDFYIKKRSNLDSYSSITFNAKKLNTKALVNESEIEDVYLAISSGSLFLLENLNLLGWHNETYFVDCVDYEYCLRSNINKLKLGEHCYTPGFDHMTEQADSDYTFLNIKMRLRKYPYTRIFDTLRGSCRIFFSALSSFNIKYAVSIIRSLFIYLFFQLLIRILNIFKK